MKNNAILFWSSILFLLGNFIISCTSFPSQTEPTISIPEKFSASGDNPRPDKWWLSFKDPRLDHLIDQALGNNLNLKSVWNRLTQAEAVARKARANLYPTLDARVGASRSQTFGDTATSDVRRQVKSFNNFSFGWVAGYELDLWGRIRSSKEAARMDLKATREDLQAAAITLSAQVAETWYSLVEQNAQLELLVHQLQTNEQIRELVTFRFRRGLVGATDVLQQRQLVESNRGEMITAESRVKVLEHQLAIFLGQAPDVQVTDRVTQLVKLPPLPDTGIPADLIKQRPDIRQAYYKLLAADRRMAAALADRFPRLSLSGQADTSGDHIRDLFDNWLATVAANLVAPLFDGGNRKAEVQRTRAVAVEALNAYGQVILDSLGEIENALIQEKKQQELIDSLRKQLELSKLVIERIRDNYTHGAIDFLRVLDALLTNQSLERQQLEAHRELIQFRIALCRALGRSWEMDHPEKMSFSFKNPSQRIDQATKASL